jgi:hypothetical protein
MSLWTRTFEYVLCLLAGSLSSFTIVARIAEVFAGSLSSFMLA